MLDSDFDCSRWRSSIGKQKRANLLTFGDVDRAEMCRRVREQG